MINLSAKAVLSMIAGVIVGAFLGLTFGMWLGVIFASGIEAFHGEMIVKAIGGSVAGSALGLFLGFLITILILALAQKYLEIRVPKTASLLTGAFAGLVVGLGSGAILQIDKMTLGMFTGFIGVLAGGCAGALTGGKVAKRIVVRNQAKLSVEDQARDDQMTAFYREKSRH